MGLPQVGRLETQHRLTENDKLILRQISVEGFQTYQELRTSILRDFNRTHSWDLMKKLVRMGLLNECVGDGGGIRGWALSPKGQSQVQSLFGDQRWTSFRPPSYRSSFDHDVTLREVRKILCGSPAVANWTPEHVLKASAMSRIKSLGLQEQKAKLLTVPDGTFEIRSGGHIFKAALELELTRKSKKRLFQKIESHVINPSIHSVFFVAGDESILRALWNVYQEVVTHSPQVIVKGPKNKIYFATLKNLRELGLNATFVTLKGTLVFAKLLV